MIIEGFIPTVDGEKLTAVYYYSEYISLRYVVCNGCMGMCTGNLSGKPVIVTEAYSLTKRYCIECALKIIPGLELILKYIGG